MNAIVIVLLFTLPLIGFILGYKLGNKYEAPVGSLICTSDEDGDYFFLELDKLPDDFVKKKEIVLRIRKKNSSYSEVNNHVERKENKHGGE